MAITQAEKADKRIEAILSEAPTDRPAMLEGIETYLRTGNVYGHFLTALLSNKFAEAVTSADGHNSKVINEWALWLWNSVPRNAWGSEGIVDDYTGLNGL